LHLIFTLRVSENTSLGPHPRTPRHHFHSSLVMSELDRIKADIEITKADIVEAKKANDREMILSLQNLLTEQLKKENLLFLAQFAPTPGNPSSKKFLFELELYFLVISVTKSISPRPCPTTTSSESHGEYWLVSFDC
jgi:hypothetical protein